jgi:lysophospholipase
MTGTVSPLYEPAMLLKRAGMIPGHDLTSEAALAKLSYLLALDLSPEEVTEQMSISLRGEFTEHSTMVFQHSHRDLPSSITNLTSLSYAISEGRVDVVQDLLKGDVSLLLNEPDYSGNTPLVSKSAARSPTVLFSPQKA